MSRKPLTIAVTGLNATDNPDLARFSFSEPHMGTLFTITLYAPSEKVAKEAVKDAFARIEELNRIMSDYREDSELMKLCRKAGIRSAGSPAIVTGQPRPAVMTNPIAKPGICRVC